MQKKYVFLSTSLIVAVAILLFLQALLVGTGDAPGRGEGDDFVGTQLRGLLDHMLQLVRLGKSHVDTDLHRSLCNGLSAAFDNQAKLTLTHIADG